MLSFLCCVGFSVVVVSEGYSLVVVCGLLIVVASLVVGHRLQVHRLQELLHMGLVSVAHGVFPYQGLNPCPLDWQWIPIHCATREVLRAFKYHRVNKEFISNHRLYRPVSM